MNKGFTMIEVMLVAVITAIMAGLIVTNFSRTRNELPLFASTLTSDIRQAQAMTVSGTLHEGTHRCGFGVAFFVDRYVVYAGPDASIAADCSTDTTYDPGEEMRTVLTPQGVELANTGDVFFVPPLPTTYLSPVGANLSIVVRQIGESCPSVACRTIIIHDSGQVETTQ